jgi:hypothetical protein
MSREFNFEPFKANEPILDQLTATRLNAILDGINRNRIEFGDNITGTRTAGGAIVRAKVGAGGAANPFPFKCNVANIDGANTLTLYPGYVGGIMPTMAGTALDSVDPIPKLFPEDDGSVFLRVNIGITTPSEDFRNNISSVEAIYTPGATAKDDSGDPLNELTMIWDDADTKASGYFMIRVASINIGEGDNPSATPTQYLFTSIRSFVIVVDDVIILAT